MCERVYIRMHRIESRFAIGPEKYTVCRHVLALFSPEILQAWAVKGLSRSILQRNFSSQCQLPVASQLLPSEDKAFAGVCCPVATYVTRCQLGAR